MTTNEYSTGSALKWGTGAGQLSVIEWAARAAT